MALPCHASGPNEKKKTRNPLMEAVQRATLEGINIQLWPLLRWMGRLADESPRCSTQGKEESGRPSCFTKGTIRYHLLDLGQRITRLSRLDAQQNHLKGLLKPSAGLYLKRAIGVCISHKSAGATLLVLPACRGHTLFENQRRRQGLRASHYIGLEHVCPNSTVTMVVLCPLRSSRTGTGLGRGSGMLAGLNINAVLFDSHANQYGKKNNTKNLKISFWTIMDF